MIENAEGQAKIISLLEHNNELLTVLVKHALGDVLERELVDTKNKKLYALTGKNIPIKTISAKTGASPATISRTWQRWERLGLLVKETKRYRLVIQ